MYQLSEVHYSVFQEEKRKLSVYDHYHTILRVCQLFPIIILGVLNNGSFYPTGYTHQGVWWMWIDLYNPKAIVITFCLGLL